MSKSGGCQDNDKGMEEIRKQISALGGMAVKAGITEKKGAKEVDGATIAQYAAYNEYGVKGPPVSQNGDGLWFIPPRPFIRGWVENRAEEIKETQKELFRLVSEGKLSARTAVGRLGQFGRDGIKRYIREGKFVDNADSTKERKRTTKKNTPLIDTGAMRDAVSYEVVKGGDT